METYKFKLWIGDWSGDGHKQYETSIIEANYPVERVQEAYKKSCKLTGLYFSNDFLPKGLSYEEIDELIMCAEYEEFSLRDSHVEILKKFNCPFAKLFEDYSCYLEDEDEESLYSITCYDMVRLLMWFITLSIPDFTWKLVSDEIPLFNRFSNKSGGIISIGYGLFS